MRGVGVLIRANELSEWKVVLGMEGGRDELCEQATARHLQSIFYGLSSQTMNLMKKCWVFNTITKAEKINNYCPH